MIHARHARAYTQHPFVSCSCSTQHPLVVGFLHRIRHRTPPAEASQRDGSHHAKNHALQSSTASSPQSPPLA
jgi:hypothetical protein